MTPPEWAVVLTVVVAALVIGVDVWLALNRHQGDTYSEVFRAAYRRWTPFGFLIVFAMGMLTGHWFWCPSPEDFTP